MTMRTDLNDGRRWDLDGGRPVVAPTRVCEVELRGREEGWVEWWSEVRGYRGSCSRECLSGDGLFLRVNHRKFDCITPTPLCNRFDTRLAVLRMAVKA